MPTEVLTCIANPDQPHTFEREIVRGRKPTTCPEHTPEKVVREPRETNADGQEIETLQCVADPDQPHDFVRVVSRGRKPTTCPEHTPEKTAVGAVEETLPCLADPANPHTFTRTRTKGRKPIECPNCKDARLVKEEEAEHLIGGIITTKAVRAIQDFRSKLRADAQLFQEFKVGDITREEYYARKVGVPSVANLPSTETWRKAVAANLI